MKLPRGIRGGGVATEKPCVIDVSRGGTKGGVILYPLLGTRHAEQCRRIYIYIYIYLFIYLFIYLALIESSLFRSSWRGPAAPPPTPPLLFRLVAPKEPVFLIA